MSRTSSHEDFIMRHRQERKDLLALTQKMKHCIPKGDKKKKKDIMTEIAVMLSTLDLKHEEERKELEVQYSSDVKEFDCEDSAMQEDKGPDSDLDEKLPNVTQKLSKAQRRRNKKANQEKAREFAISQQELENIKGARFLEAQEIANKLSLRNLVLHEVPPDGNCLFKAIEHQLATHNIHEMTATVLREATSNYLMSHTEEYRPFLTNPQTNNMFTESEYMGYCEKIKDPGVWGGQVEIQALTHICGRPIEIIQAYGPDIMSGEQSGDGIKLIISYHKYQFGLGAHYNSTISI